MSNMLDYIEWRGDIPFTAAPFNEVDNLVLARLSYIPLNGIINGFNDKTSHAAAGGSKEMSDITAEHLPEHAKSALPGYIQAPPVDMLTVTSLYLRKRNDAAWFSGMLDPVNDPLLIEKAASSRRFGNIKLCFSENIFDKSITEQFCAVTAILDDNSAYISFRGTDNTIVGWKEDFNMTFMKNIPSQIDAVRYLEAAADKLPDISELRVGGHSKGGNLAIYSSLKCRPDIQDRIVSIYNNDGPGFSKGFAEYHASDDIINRIHTYVPQTSIVGMLLNHPENYTVVESSQNGFLQHDVYSWQVLGPIFIHRAEISEESQLIDRTITEWLSKLSNEQRSIFTDTLFGILESANIDTLNNMTENPKKMFNILRELKNVDDESRSHTADVLKSLFKIAGRNITSEFSNYISRS